MYSDEQIKEWFKTLERFDWYYAMSDDHSVWQAGEKASENLDNLCKEHPVVARMRQDWSNYMFNGEPWGTEKPAKPVVEDYLGKDS